MKKLALLIFSACFLLMNSNSQTIELTFTAINSAQWIQLDSIKVMNRTQGGDTVLYYPDTVFSFFVTGINEFQKIETGFQLHQNYPNPIVDQTTIAVNIPSAGKVNISVTDILGRKVTQLDQDLVMGLHSFRFIPGNSEMYFFTAMYKNESKSIKMLCSPIKSGSKASLNYTGTAEETASKKFTKSIQSFFFNIGDELLYIGYYDTLQSGMLDSPEESDTYIFQFAYNIPCPGTPTVDNRGQVYNTIQIYSQCWLRENLNVGTMIDRNDYMEDNGVIEKYCYDNEPDSCKKYGGLYGWDEMMQYTTEKGVQGICPTGWHLPTDEEWKVLEGAVDSQYGIGDLEWDREKLRGYDAGKNLKTTIGWNDSGIGTDQFGFSGLPGGYNYTSDGTNWWIGQVGNWWASEEWSSHRAWDRKLVNFSHLTARPSGDADFFLVQPKTSGLSVRCIKDTYPSDNFTELSFSAIDDVEDIQLDSIKVMNWTHDGEKVLYYPDTTINLEFGLPNYHTGDQLLLVGYYGTLQSGMIDTPEESKTYTFQFAYDIPCPDMPTIVYEGQTYNTVQIMSQCWLKENLNVGTRINGDTESSDNDIVEKYCYNNLESNCNLYGGFYQWDEMMKYANLGGENGVQGICPPGWHISSDEEWKMLEGAVDSQYGIGDSIWNEIDYRGFDAGKNLKTDNNWNGTDLFGFSGLPSGYRAYDGNFYGLNDFGGWWVSTESNNDNAWFRGIVYNYQEVRRHPHHSKVDGLSVRCIKD